MLSYNESRISSKSIFITDNHRQYFIHLLQVIHIQYHADIHAYCLMNNHYHLLIKTPEGNISQIMRHLDGVYTQYFNHTTERDGPLFRGRFKSILVEQDAYFLQLSRYIHLNPLKANLVKRPEEYLWSSYRSYLSDHPPGWLNVNYVLSYFGNHLRSKKYKDYLEEGVDIEIDNFYSKSRILSILGTDSYIKNIAEKWSQV